MKAFVVSLEFEKFRAKHGPAITGVYGFPV